MSPKGWKGCLNFWCLIFLQRVLFFFKWHFTVLGFLSKMYSCENYMHQRLVEVATDLVLYTFYRAHWHIVTCGFNPMDAVRPPLSIKWGWSLQAASNCTKVMSETKRWTSLVSFQTYNVCKKGSEPVVSPLSVPRLLVYKPCIKNLAKTCILPSKLKKYHSNWNRCLPQLKPKRGLKTWAQQRHELALQQNGCTSDSRLDSGHFTIEQIHPLCTSDR